MWVLSCDFICYLQSRLKPVSSPCYICATRNRAISDPAQVNLVLVAKHITVLPYSRRKHEHLEHPTSRAPRHSPELRSKLHQKLPI